MKIYIYLLIVGILLVSCTSQPTMGQQSEPLRLGVILPLSGEAAVYGEPVRAAMQLALSELQNQGKQIELLLTDGGCSSRGGLNAAQKLIEVDGVDVILGGWCSGETLGAAPVAEQNRAILFSSSSGSPEITLAGDYVFRNFPSDAYSGAKAAQVAIERGVRKVAIIAEQTDYSVALRDVFSERYTSLGGEVVLQETVLLNEKDFRTLLLKAKEKGAQGLYIPISTPATYHTFLQQLAKLDFDFPLFTNEAVSSTDLLNTYSPELEGAIFTEPHFDQNRGEVKEFFMKLQGDVSAVPPIYLATAYDAVFILEEAARVCFQDTTCMKSYLYGIENRQGIAGLLTIDNNGDAVKDYDVKIIQQGKVAAFS